VCEKLPLKSWDFGLGGAEVMSVSALELLFEGVYKWIHEEMVISE
jgi:hypothetical protein